MKRLIIFVLTLCVMSAAFAINGVIKGKVTDATTGKPLEFVTVSLSDGASKAINGAISDIDGEYSFAGLAAGTYEVKFTFLGYKEFSRKVEVTASSPVRGLDVKMVEDTQMLGEVEVVGQKPQMRFEIDKRVFNADQAIAAIGGSASDLLSNVPSIDVDTEGTISLRGNSSVTIWINGPRPSTASRSSLIRQPSIVPRARQASSISSSRTMPSRDIMGASKLRPTYREECGQVPTSTSRQANGAAMPTQAIATIAVPMGDIPTVK